VEVVRDSCLRHERNTVCADGGDSSFPDFSATVPLSHLAAMARRTRRRHLSRRRSHPSGPSSDAYVVGSSGILDVVADSSSLSLAYISIFGSIVNVRLSLVESSEADIFRSSLSMALSPPPYSIYRWRILEDRRDGARDVRAFRARHLPCRIEYGEDESHLDGTKPPGVTPVDEKMYEEILEKKRAPRYCMAFRT
jgi:hypothetical protein